MRLSGARLLVTAALVAACTDASEPSTPLAWSQVPHDETALGGARLASIVAVTSGGPGLVAVGFDGTNDDIDAAVWTSADGISWLRTQADERVFGGEGFQLMASVTVAGGGLIAVGSHESRGGFDAAVWISGDGMKWSRVPPDEVVLGGDGFQSMASVTAGGSGAVAVGSEVTRNDEDAAVWTSADGFVWTRVRDEVVLGGDGFQSMASVTVGGPGLVAVGYERMGGDLDAAVWTSVDGLTWSRVPHDEGALGGEGFQSMASVTAGGPGLVRSWVRAVGPFRARGCVDLRGWPHVVAGSSQRDRVRRGWSTRDAKRDGHRPGSVGRRVCPVGWRFRCGGVVISQWSVVDASSPRRGNSGWGRFSLHVGSDSGRPRLGSSRGGLLTRGQGRRGLGGGGRLINGGCMLWSKSPPSDSELRLRSAYLHRPNTKRLGRGHRSRLVRRPCRGLCGRAARGGVRPVTALCALEARLEAIGGQLQVGQCGSAVQRLVRGRSAFAVPGERDGPDPITVFENHGDRFPLRLVNQRFVAAEFAISMSHRGRLGRSCRDNSAEISALSDALLSPPLEPKRPATALGKSHSYGAMSRPTEATSSRPR